MWTPRNLKLLTVHRSPIDGDGGVSLSLLLPVIHNQLLGFADVEMEVVILAPRCQDVHVCSLAFFP